MLTANDAAIGPGKSTANCTAFPYEKFAACCAANLCEWESKYRACAAARFAAGSVSDTILLTGCGGT